MDDHTKSSRRYFTEAARAAAAEAKRLKRENAVPRDTPAVFVVRVPPANKMFGWEIRRFGSLVLTRSEDRFTTAADARAAGEAALAKRSGHVPTSRPHE